MRKKHTIKPILWSLTIIVFVWLAIITGKMRDWPIFGIVLLFLSFVLHSFLLDIHYTSIKKQYGKIEEHLRYLSKKEGS